MTTKLGKDMQAYNACVEALNDYDEQITALAQQRDSAWVAADALVALQRHGQAHLPRNIKITSGCVQR